MPAPQPRWRSPSELIEIGFTRSRVVMMNEAHSGLRRSVRTRIVGKSVLQAAHEAGVRQLAMEALRRDFAAVANESRAAPDESVGYLSQPELRDLIAAALDLGWTLVPYEADFDSKPPRFANLSWEETNWREEQQALNLIEALASLNEEAKLLVWCGNGHLTKHRFDEWCPMGFRFHELSGLEPFSIDQTQSVRFDAHQSFGAPMLEQWADEIAAFGGAAGFLIEEIPDTWRWLDGSDAYVLSDDNELT
jgi:hypothetical protein